jgi:hypothetical protein
MNIQFQAIFFGHNVLRVAGSEELQQLWRLRVVSRQGTTTGTGDASAGLVWYACSPMVLLRVFPFFGYAIPSPCESSKQ